MQMRRQNDASADSNGRYDRLPRRCDSCVTCSTVLVQSPISPKLVRKRHRYSLWSHDLHAGFVRGAHETNATILRQHELRIRLRTEPRSVGNAEGASLTRPARTEPAGSRRVDGPGP